MTGQSAFLQVDEVAIVRVPVDADVGDAVVGPEDRDERHAGLDQPPRLQHRLAVDVHAVAFAHATRLLRQIERARVTSRCGQQREGPLVVRAHRLHLGLLFQAADLLVELAQQLAGGRRCAAAARRRAARSRRRGSPAARVGVDAHRVVDRAEPAGPLAVRSARRSAARRWAPPASSTRTAAAGPRPRPSFDRIAP